MPVPPRSRKLAAVAEPKPKPAPPDLRTAVEAALAGMAWLTASDDALKALALNYAEQIERAATMSAELDLAWAEARGDKSIIKRLERLEAAANLTKMLGWLGPQLQGVMRDLGGTPAARKAMAEAAPVGGRLAAIRAAAAAAAAGAGAGPDAPEDLDTPAG